MCSNEATATDHKMESSLILLDITYAELQYGPFEGYEQSDASTRKKSIN